MLMTCNTNVFITGNGWDPAGGDVHHKVDMSDHQARSKMHMVKCKYLKLSVRDNGIHFFSHLGNAITRTSTV